MLPPSIAAATTPQPRRKTKARVGSTILVILGASIAALVLGTVVVFRGITKTATVTVRRAPLDVARAIVTDAPLGRGVEVVSGNFERGADIAEIFEVPRGSEADGDGGDADDDEVLHRRNDDDGNDAEGRHRNDGVDPTEGNVDRAGDDDNGVVASSTPPHHSSHSEEPTTTAGPELHQSHATRPLGGHEDAEIETPHPDDSVAAADAAEAAADQQQQQQQQHRAHLVAFSALVIGRLGVDPRPLLTQLHRSGLVRHGIDTLIYVVDRPTTLSRADAVYAAVRRADQKHTHGDNVSTSPFAFTENATESTAQVRRFLSDLFVTSDNGKHARDPYAPGAAPFLTVTVDPPSSALFAPWRDKVLQGMRASPHPHVLVLDAGLLFAPTVLPSVAELIAHPTTAGANASDGVDGARLRRDLFHTVETAPFATCTTLSPEALRSGQGDADSVARRSAAARGGGVAVDAGSRPALHFRPRSSVYGFEVFLDRLGSTRRSVERAFSNGRPKKCFAPSPRCFFAARDVLTEITNAAHAKGSDHVLHLSSDDLARHHVDDPDVARALGRLVDAEMEVYERVITAISLPDLMHMPAALKAIIGQVSLVSKRVADVLAALAFDQEEVNYDPELQKRVRADIAKDDPGYTKDFGHLEAHWARLSRVVELAETLIKFRDVRRTQAEAVSHGVIPPELTEAMPQLETDVELLWRVIGDLIRSGHVHSPHFTHSVHEAHHRPNKTTASGIHPHTYPQPCVHLAHTFVAFPDGVHPHQHVEAGAVVSSAFRSEAYVEVLRPFLASNGIPRTITSVVSLGFAMQPQNFVGDAWRQHEPDFRRRFLRLATPASRRSRPQQHRTAGGHFSFATRPPAPTAVAADAQPDDDCTALARDSALAGAADTLRRLRLRAHKARFCGLLWVLQHGGVYMDEGLVPKGIRPLASWYDPDAPVQWSLSAALAGDHRAAAIDTRFVAAQAGEACLHRALSGVVRAAESMRWDPVAFEDVGLGVWMQEGLANAADECSPAHHSLRAGILDDVIEEDNGNMEHRAVAANTRNALADVRGVPPLRIVVSPGSARWLTEPEHEAAQSFTEHEPKLGHLVVSDDECLRLFESEGPFTSLRTAYQRLPLRQRSHLCGLAAVHRYGGIYTHAYAAWVDDMDSWLPRLPPSAPAGGSDASLSLSSSRVTFVAAPSVEEGAYWDMDDATTASGDAASTWLFGAAPKAPAMRNMLAILDSRVRRLVSKAGDDSEKVPTAAFLTAVGPLAFGHAALQDATVTWVRFADCVQLAAPFHSHRQHQFVSGHAMHHRHRHQEHAHQHDDHDVTAHRHLALLRPSAGTAATSYVGIPLLLWRTWHGTPSTLPLELRALTDPWHREEPAFTHTLFNDSQCLRAIESELPEVIVMRQAGVAARVSKADVASAFAEVPVSMLRGRLCRLVALFLHGGIHADLDVAWRRPVEEWIDEGTVVDPSSDGISRLWAAEQRDHRLDGQSSWPSSSAAHHAIRDDSHEVHYASGRLDAKAAAVQSLIAAAFGTGDHRRLVPGKPTVVTVAAPSSEHLPSSLDNAAPTANWLTAATPRHVCIEEALGRAVRAVLAHRHDSDPSDLIHDVERALPDAIQGCSGIDGAGQLGVLPHDYFELNFARHEPLDSLSASTSEVRQWRITVASMKARHAWLNHLTVVVAGRARQPREQRLWRSWRRLEPRMRHMRLTDADCYQIVLKHKDGLLPRLAANFWHHPATARLNICRFVVVYEHGGVFADATVGLVRPLAAWFPLIPPKPTAPLVNGTNGAAGVDSCTLTIAPEFEPAKDVLPPLTKGFRPVYTDLFAAHRHCPCLRKVLRYMDHEISEIPPQHWTDHRSVPERVGSAAFGIALRSAADDNTSAVISPAQDTACQRVPFRVALADVIASTKRDPDATAWRHSTIPARRNTITPMLPPAQPFSVTDAMWHLEEPSLFRAVDTDCDQWRLSLGGDDARWRNLLTVMNDLPFPLLQRVCAVAMVVAHGGFAIDPAAAFRQPMERWMPKGGTIIVTAANGTDWSRAAPNSSSTGALNATILKLRRAEEDHVVSGVITSDAQRRYPRLEDPYRLPLRPEEGPAGNETHPPRPAFSSFFFAATQRHPCLLRVLDVMDFRIGASIRRDAPGGTTSHRLWTMQEYRNRSKVPHDPAVALFESWLVGDLAFSEGLETCGAVDVVLPFRAVAEEFMTYKPSTSLLHQQPRERIPRVIHAVWKNAQPEGLAGKYHAAWIRNEPAFERRVVQDAECAELAQDFPELAEVYANLPLNVMRADVCRLLAVHRYGGIYMDLDVAWTTPLDQWLNLTRDIVIAQENDLHTCNWIFAARPRHPCIARTIRLIARRAAPGALKWARQHKYDFVHYVTGPRAFTDGMRGCAEATLNGIDVTNRFVSHRFASTTWSHLSEAERGGFDSWRKERDALWHGTIPPESAGPAV